MQLLLYTKCGLKKSYNWKSTFSKIQVVIRLSKIAINYKGMIHFYDVLKLVNCKITKGVTLFVFKFTQSG